MTRKTLNDANVQAFAEQLLVQKFAPPAVLVNETGDILYVAGRTGDYLEPAAGKANWNVHVMARPALRPQLSAALLQAVKDRVSIDVPGICISETSNRLLDLRVEVIEEPKALAGTVMITFREVAINLHRGSRHGVRAQIYIHVAAM